MPRKISSSLTEFFKVYGVLCVIMFFTVFGWRFFYSSDLGFSLLMLAVFTINIFFAVDFWRMKEVELDDAGLIITKRVFFKQQSIFVPYENIKEVKNRFKWLGNRARTTIEFNEKTELGDEIYFLAKGFTRSSQAKTVEELKRATIQNKNAERLNSAFSEKE
jgi:hypothetical protein